MYGLRISVCRHVLLIRSDYYHMERLSCVFPYPRQERVAGQPVTVPEEARERVEWLFRGIRDELRTKDAGYEHALAGSVTRFT